MDDAELPTSLNEFLSQRLQALPAAARLVVVLDPGGRLGLEAELALGRRKWQVVRYDGNDLAFRKQFQLDGRVFVWVTGPAHIGTEMSDRRIDLSSLTDIVHKADDIFDLSLTGVLIMLLPGETWPPAPVERHAEIISTRLDVFVKAYLALRPHLGRGTVLDAHSVRAMVLHCLQPDVAPQELLFKHDTLGRVLSHYISLAWGSDWDEPGRELLRQQAREASRLPLGNVEAWFEAAPDDLARFLYLYRFLSRMRVPNIVNQVRGLSVIGFDPEPLEPAMSIVLTLWERDAAWRGRIIRQAEYTLDIGDIARAAKLADLSSPDKVADAIAQAEAPALIYLLGTHLLETAYDAKQMSRAMTLWSERRPLSLNDLKDGDTPFARAALAMAAILDEAAFISGRVAYKIEPFPDLARLLDWYVEGGYYDLEYAHARALVALNRLPDEAVRDFVHAYLDHLRKRLRDFLDKLDHELARHIAGDWSAYLNHPRLSIRVLRDLVKAAHLKPTTDACLWFIVFDGMRYDTWQRVVKPRLAERFELKKEKTYLSLLPSWTRIARTALIAGKLPDFWSSHRKTFTFNQEILASVFFDLTEKEQERKLRFYSGMESDRTTVRFNRQKRYPYNVLVFNISDDDLHKQREHVAALNENVESALKRILDFLDGLIRPNDTVIVSSDHGFMELDAEDAIPIKDDTRWQRFMQGGENPVRFRYIMGIDRPDGLPAEAAYNFEYRQLQNGKFTVAIGRKWFKREGTTQFDRYAHGGLSSAEMVVPGAVLQLITEKKIAIVFEDLPEVLEVDEDVSLTVGIWLRNRGNQPGDFEMICGADSDTVAQTIRGTLAPGERQEVKVVITPVVRSGKPLTQSIRLSLKHTTVEGKPKAIRREIPIKVRVRTDKVEIDFGALDDLDR